MTDTERIARTSYDAHRFRVLRTRQDALRAGGTWASVWDGVRPLPPWDGLDDYVRAVWRERAIRYGDGPVTTAQMDALHDEVYRRDFSKEQP